jgi:serine/threonine protein kinase
MSAVGPCPDQNTYRRLIHGELPPSEAECLSQHLDGCSSCANAVQTLLREDTLFSAVRDALAGASSGEGVPADLVRRLLALRQCVDPPAAAADHPSLAQWGLSQPQGPDEIGRLAHYRVLKVLGEGGMGVVFLAEDTLLGRTVALKTMRPAIAADPRNRQRFLREARAAAKVENDHIVPIYAVGEDHGVPWLAMPFLKGQSLDSLLKRVKVLKPAQAAQLGEQVAKGLVAAHAAGLVHRDVKPANIWVEPEGGGRARLLDFGLACDQNPSSDSGQDPLTSTGAVIGTPAFMALEQARGEPIDARADLFSLGCVLYRAVTGRLPFEGQGKVGTLLALATETPPTPHEVNSEVPRPLSALISSLLAKDRSARPSSALAVAAALHVLQESSTDTVPMAKPLALLEAAQPEPNPWSDLTHDAPRTAPARRRRWRVAAAASLLLLALGGALAAGVVVIIKDRAGKEVARVTVPEGGAAEVKQDGDSGGAKVAPAGVNPDRRAAEWVLSVGGTVKVRPEGQDKDTEIKDAKDLPAAPFKVVAVQLRANQKVDDAGLQNLKGLVHLKGLDLSSTKVSNAGLEHLKGLVSLEVLELYETPVSDAGLVHLRGLTNLTGLGLGETSVSDEGLPHLKGLTGLVVLGLGNTGVSDAGLKHLKGLTELTYLHLGLTKVSDAGLKHLTGLSKLSQLWLYNTKVSNAGLADLRGLGSLTQLDLSMTDVTPDAIADLQKALPKCKIVFDPPAK